VLAILSVAFPSLNKFVGGKWTKAVDGGGGGGQ